MSCMEVFISIKLYPSHIGLTIFLAKSKLQNILVHTKGPSFRWGGLNMLVLLYITITFEFSSSHVLFYSSWVFRRNNYVCLTSIFRYLNLRITHTYVYRGWFYVWIIKTIVISKKRRWHHTQLSIVVRLFLQVRLFHSIIDFCMIVSSKNGLMYPK